MNHLIRLTHVGQLLYRYCGRTAPPPTISVANVMSVLFMSDAQIHVGYRFKAEFVAFTGVFTTEAYTGTGTPPPKTTTEMSAQSTTTEGGGGETNCSGCIIF